ncbi:MAG: tetratricopeptide repeat protein [Bacteroidales bacterium]|nr:tetratricopeptide repeat protein [Bacteroidales bacterium]
MDQEREDQEFEREEDERLRRAFERYDSLHNSKGRGASMPEGGENLIAEENRFEEDEYEYIIDKYVDLYNIDMANRVSEEGFLKYPYSSELLVRYCDAMVIRKELDKALQVLDHYKDSFPPNADIYLSYSRVYIGKKDLQSARRYYDMAIAVESTPEEVCDSVHTLAQDCMEIEQWQEAIFYLDRTAELTARWNAKHNEKEKDENLNSFWFDYAFCSEKIGQEDKAVELYQKCLDIDPFNDIIWHNLGIIYEKKRLYRKSYEAFGYAIALNPQNIHALFNMGQLCLECKLPQEALKHFNDFNRLEKNDPDGICGQALSYFLLGDLNQAEILYRKALIFNPEHPGAKRGLEDVQAEKKIQEKLQTRRKTPKSGKDRQDIEDSGDLEGV